DEDRNRIAVAVSSSLVSRQRPAFGPGEDRNAVLDTYPYCFLGQDLRRPGEGGRGRENSLLASRTVIAAQRADPGQSHHSRCAGYDPQ
ncbi:MAG: hypothetical protein ACRDR6_25870, partial [Pseudonocardiaceae bacterium]